MPERIALLGSTGSIGSQALDVISRHPGRFAVESLIAGNNVGLLVKQARKYNPSSVVIGNKEHFEKLRDSLKDTDIKVYAGEEAIDSIVTAPGVDVVVASIVGYSGLRSTIAAIRSGKKIALANKETLVVAGAIIDRIARESGSTIIPVDSEHSAIFQCLAGEAGNPVEKITLTASGGPFLNHSTEELLKVAPCDALRHPNWQMGSKITIDSASMMNKGLEVIEAKWLFKLDPGQIDVIIHPQSIIHSMVHFADGSVKAQLGVPDMRVPILYALTYPGRLHTDLPRLDFSRIPSLTFFEPDKRRFRNLQLAYEALELGGNMPCIMNAANESAVAAFLKNRVGFMQMSDVVEHAMAKCSFEADPGLDHLEESDRMARIVADEYILKYRN